MRYLTIIPARGGSKGIPNKNIKNIRGLPMIAWSIQHSLKCGEIDRTIVSTDSRLIAETSIQFGAEVPFMRPDYLAQDTTPTEPVLLHVLEELEKRESYVPDAVILLQPTSPLRYYRRLNEAIAQFEIQKADSLLSVCENHHFFWRNLTDPVALYDFQNRPRRQDISDSDRWYRENGSIYITKTEVLKSYRNRLAGNIAMLVMSEEESWEIDSFTDFKIVEMLLEGANLNVN